MQVGPIDHAVGLPVRGQRLLADRRAHHELTRAHVAHHQVGRKVGHIVDRLSEPEVPEHAERVGPELDAGADLAEGVGLLEHLHRVALARQHQRSSQPADAATGHDEGLPLLGHRLLPSLRRAGIDRAHARSDHTPADSSARPSQRSLTRCARSERAATACMRAGTSA